VIEGDPLAEGQRKRSSLLIVVGKRQNKSGGGILGGAIQIGQAPSRQIGEELLSGPSPVDLAEGGSGVDHDSGVDLVTRDSLERCYQANQGK